MKADSQIANNDFTQEVISKFKKMLLGVNYTDDPDYISIPFLRKSYDYALSLKLDEITTLKYICTQLQMVINEKLKKEMNQIKNKTTPEKQSVLESGEDIAARILPNLFTEIIIGGIKIDPESHEPVDRRISQRDLVSYFRTGIQVKLQRLSEQITKECSCENK